MNQQIIFSQQPADLILVLSRYEEDFEVVEKTVIICINVKNNYRFLESLNLKNVELFFIHQPSYPRFYNPLSIIRAKRNIFNIKKKYLEKMQNNNIYYFAKGNDWLTAGLIYYLLQNNNVFFSPAIKFDLEESIQNIKNKLISIIFSYITKMDSNLIRSKNHQFMYFDDKRIQNTEQAVLDLSKYLFKVSEKKKSILFLDSDLSSYNLIKEFENSTYRVLEAFKKLGYKIYLKAHPRLGCTKGIEPLVEEILPDYIPAEFIDVDSFDYVVGILSNGLSTLSQSHVNIVSIIDIFTFVDEKEQKERKKKLFLDSNKKLRFITSVNQLTN